MSRHFIAIVPAGLNENLELKQLLGKLKRTMKERGQEVRWTPADLWHVTLQFLGDVSDSSQIDKVRQAFRQWSLPPIKLILRIQGMGAFAEPDEARVLWLGVQQSQDFLSLKQNLTAWLEENQIDIGAKEFKPHLTLARFRNPINATDLIQLGGRKRFGDYPVHELVLFESVLQGNIVKYIAQERRTIE